MSRPPLQHDERLRRLVDAALDEQITPAEWDELCAALRDDAAARVYYRRRAGLHAVLSWDAVHAGGAAAGAGVQTKPEAEHEMSESMAEAAVVEPIARRLPWGWMGAVAAAAAVAVGVTLFVTRPVGPADLDAPRVAAAAPTVGLLLDAEAVQWRSEPIAIGGDLTRQTIAIGGGRLGVQLGSGVEVECRGATTVTFDNPMSVRLHDGSLHATVPEGAEGFTVHVPGGARVVDLGTSFLVETGPGGASRVRVDRGAVRVEMPSGAGREVHAGYEAQLDTVAGTLAVDLGDSFDALAHRWTFNDGTAADAVGAAHGTLEGGASIDSGRLVLDGVDDYLITPAVLAELTEKTLVAWVAPANLEQRDGGVLSVQEFDTADRFDAIVYGELTPGVWMSGSNSYTRTQPEPQDGTPETAGADRAVMIAIAYDAHGGVRIYRDGEPYAQYTASHLRPYSAARVLMGLRHEHAVTNRDAAAPAGDDPFFAGRIDEARVYRRALGAAEIRLMHEQGPAAATVPGTPGAATPTPPTEGDSR